MERGLKFNYDRMADIMYISNTDPYPEQESEEIGDDVIARFNPKTNEIENLEILFFSSRLLREDFLNLPIVAHLMKSA